VAGANVERPVQAVDVNARYLSGNSGAPNFHHTFSYHQEYSDNASSKPDEIIISGLWASVLYE